MNKYILFLGPIPLFLSQIAIADIFWPSAATLCSPKTGRFEISAVIEANEGDAGNVPPKIGFSLLSEGNHQLNCKLSESVIVKSTIRVYGADNGMCMGSGEIIISNLAVNNKSLVKEKRFNWHCFDEPIIVTSISVHQKNGKIELKRCTAESWEWGVGFVKASCKSRVIQ